MRKMPSKKTVMRTANAIAVACGDALGDMNAVFAKLAAATDDHETRVASSDWERHYVAGVRDGLMVAGEMIGQLKNRHLRRMDRLHMIGDPKP